MRTKSCQVVQESFLSSGGDLSTLNAYILFKVKHKRKTIQFADFQLELIGQLIEKYAELMHLLIGDNRICHFPSLGPVTATRNIGRRTCIVCNHTSRHEKKNINTR